MRRKSERIIRFCVVCGDKAKGMNFNALTCQSCKAFFFDETHYPIKN